MLKYWQKIQKALFGKKAMAILVVVVLVCVITPQLVFALTPTDDKVSSGPIKTYTYSILSPIFFVMRSVLFLLTFFVVSPFIQAASAIQTSVGTCAADGTGTGFLSNICAAWQFIRNFVNMLFILMLVVIAIATILRIQAYSYKKVLGILLLMALLVNFSLVIGQAILKFADVLQMSIMDLSSRAQLNKLAWNLISYSLPTIESENWLQAAWNTLAVNYTPGMPLAMEIVNFTISFFAFTALAAIGGFLLIRLVALWVLLTLSPLAYALFAVPGMAGLAKQWWSSFFKYAFFAPIMFFFIRIAYIVNENTADFMGVNNLCDLYSLSGVTNCAISYSLGSVLIGFSRKFVVIGFLFAALFVAKKLSIVGAGFLVGLGEKGLRLPLVGAAALGGALGGAAVGAIGRTYSRRLGDAAGAAIKRGDKRRATLYSALQFLNPKVAKEAWTARQKEKETEAYTHSTGYARDFLNKYMPTEWHQDKEGNVSLGQETMYGRLGEKAIVNHKKKEWEGAQLSEEEKVQAYLGAKHPVEKEAIRQLLIEGRHEDGLKIIEALQEQGRREQELMRKFIADGHSEDASRQMAKNQIDQEVVAGKLPKATYDAVADDMEEYEMYKSMGKNEGEIGSTFSADSELGEAERKIRALGKETRLGNTFYATASTQYWKDLEGQEGKTAMLQQLSGLDLKSMAVSKTEKLLDKDGNEVKDASGKTVEVPVELEWKFKDKDGKDQIRKITNSQDFLNAVGETSKKNGIAYESGSNLQYEVAGRMKAKSASKRILRGDTEMWGASIEPAAWMEQDQNNDFLRFTSYGEEQIRGLSSAQANSFGQSRRMQARAMKIGGFYMDEKTGKTTLVRPEILKQLIEMNEDFGEKLVQKADFDEDAIKKIVDDLNQGLAAPKYFVGDKSARGGYGIALKPSKPKASKPTDESSGA